MELVAIEIQKIRGMNRREKRRLKNVIISVLISVFVILGVSAIAYEPKSDEAILAEVLPNYDIVEVYISDGDKAWNIQRKLTPNEDIRYVLWLGELLNGKSMGNISAGETVMFLKEKSN